MTEDGSSQYRRVIIVDPQLKDRNGHNYRYCKGIVAELGLPAIVISSVEFNTKKERSLKIRPCLSFDQYNNSAFKEGFKPSLIEKIKRYKNRLFILVSKDNGIWEKTSPLGLSISFFFKFISFLFFLPALVYQLVLLFLGRGSSAHQDRTALELLSCFKSINLKKGDLVIFQTMMWPTFESLLELRLHVKKTYESDALFIVHEDWLIYNTAFLRFTPAKFQKRVLEALPFSKSKVLSTNVPLSKYCKKWCEYSPDIVKEIEFPVEELPASSMKINDNKRILIPGVYRGDKNFESINILAETIAKEFENIEFIVHESVLARVAIPAQLGDLFSSYADVTGAKQWLEFLNDFDLILLPYGDTYRHRISGIIHEARLLNIPVSCHKEIADASLLKNSNCLFTNKAKSIVTAVSIGLNFDRKEKFYSDTYPKSISELIRSQEGWVAKKNKPVAVQVKPAWTRCGTSVVLDAQLDYLLDRDYFVIEIYLKTEPWLATPPQIDFMWQVLRGGREYTGGMIARVLLKDVRLFPLLSYLLKLFRKRIPAFFKRENIHSTWCKPDKILSRFLKKNKADIVLVNHIFNADFAYKYLPSKKYICETHDIQINQLLLRRPELLANYNNELKYELDLLAKFDAVVNLNKVEQKIIEASIGSSAHYIRPPIVYRQPSKSYSSLEKLISEQSKYKHISHLPKKFDLLIIGDGHPANIESCQWFLDKIYRKLPKKTTLGLAGKIISHLHIDWDNKDNINIHPIGFIDQLSNIYDFTKILILPDKIGEGIPIKTDEAIANQVPFIATTHALRGFNAKELKEVGLNPAGNDIEMINTILETLKENLLIQTVRSQSKMLSQIYNIEDYYVQWDNLCQSQ